MIKSDAERQSRSDNVDELDVLVIGAGFAGLYQLDRLRSLGFNVKVFEAGAEIGGVWYWNCYPGARVDSQGAIYQFSREDLWSDWSYDELYPSREQVRGYFQHVDKKLDLSRDIRFNTRVRSAEFDEGAGQWIVRANEDVVVRARFVVVCSGFAAKPYVPAIEGLNNFPRRLPSHGSLATAGTRYGWKASWCNRHRREWRPSHSRGGQRRIPAHRLSADAEFSTAHAATEARSRG
jgi:cation diffusion facilitator CzcD-associated flavoprotein CzcO